jgi:hypothetical protein
MMTHQEKVKIIQFLRPNAEFILRGEVIEWLDQKQIEPTQAEIENAKNAYLEKVEADKKEVEAKRKTILDKLGITEAEAKLLLS